MAIGTNIKRRFGNALASAAFAGLTCFGAVAMAQTPVLTAPDDVMLNQVRADLKRILAVTDLGVMSFGDAHIEPIDIHWGRIIDGAPLVHYGEFPGLDGTPSGSSAVFDILNRRGELVEQFWVGIFIDAELLWDCSTGVCVLPQSSEDRATVTEAAITGASLTPEDPFFPVYIMVGVIDPDTGVKWVQLGANPQCPSPTIRGTTFLGDGCEEIGTDGEIIFVSALAPTMSGLSSVEELSHTVLLDASSVEYSLVTILFSDVLQALVTEESLITTLMNVGAVLTQ